MRFGETTLRGYSATPPDMRFGETTLRGYSASLPDPKRRTRPHRPLRGRTFLKQTAFLTGSSRGLRLRLSTMLPKPHVRLLQRERFADDFVNRFILRWVEGLLFCSLLRIVGFLRARNWFQSCHLCTSCHVHRS